MGRFLGVERKGTSPPGVDQGQGCPRDPAALRTCWPAGRGVGGGEPTWARRQEHSRLGRCPPPAPLPPCGVPLEGNRITPETRSFVIASGWECLSHTHLESLWIRRGGERGLECWETTFPNVSGACSLSRVRGSPLGVGSRSPGAQESPVELGSHHAGDKEVWRGCWGPVALRGRLGACSGSSRGHKQKACAEAPAPEHESGNQKVPLTLEVVSLLNMLYHQNGANAGRPQDDPGRGHHLILCRGTWGKWVAMHPPASQQLPVMSCPQVSAPVSAGPQAAGTFLHPLQALLPKGSAAFVFLN